MHELRGKNNMDMLLADNGMEYSSKGFTICSNAGLLHAECSLVLRTRYRSKELSTQAATL